MRNLQAALDVLGAEDSKVKEELQAALQRAKEHVAKKVQSVRLCPEAAKTAARLKVDRLEKAVEALGDYDGPELAGLKQALKKARELAQELPIDVQITQCKEFIERSEKRLAKMEAERIAETKVLEEGRARLFRLEQALSVPVGNVADVTMVAADTEVELARLRAQLAEFQDNVVTERPRVRQSGRWRSRAPHADVGARRIIRVDGRQASRFARSDERRRQCAGVDRDIEVVRSRQTHVRVDWVRVVSFTRSCDARYGLRGVRVGEASHTQDLHVPI